MHDAERSQVLLIGQIGTAPEQGRQLLAETLLKANYLFIGTNGATLCLNPSTDSYELLLPVKLKDLTVDEFSAHFERMIENLHTWWVMLDNYAENEARKGSSSDQGEGFDRSNNISGDLMRV